MPLVNFTNLDFDQIKTTLKNYLKANSNFTDYDFEGSNLSTILDVLAYNTYITSYNANMLQMKFLLIVQHSEKMLFHLQEILDMFQSQERQQHQQLVFS